MTELMTLSKFNSTLNGGLRSAQNVKAKVQICAMDALYHFQKSGDTTRMTILIEKVKANKGLNTTALKQYMEAHAPVEYGRGKDGQPGFVKRGKGEPKITIPDVDWFDYKNGATQPQPVVLDQKVTSILKAMKKASENNQEVKVKDMAAFRDAMRELNKLVDWEDETEAAEA